mmetsp:Transcript_11380/g.30657  ORF Transcript_11380/g.30657 Transcript_11380/m.30657 type:complete len:384 (-) Transcript_11380:337-1488(-)
MTRRAIAYIGCAPALGVASARHRLRPSCAQRRCAARKGGAPMGRTLHTLSMNSDSGSPLVVLCPGQGAQALGMAKAWAAASPAAAAVLESADEILMSSDLLKDRLTTIINDGPKERLDRTDVAQPAIFAASMACWEGAKATGALGSDAEERLALSAGLSLGEYTALVVAGRMKFEDALQLVALRGRAMQDAADASNGGMAAILGADEAAVDEVVQEGLTRSNAAAKGLVLVAANFNAPGQIVISGSKDAVAAASEFAANERKLRAVVLDVAGAFHSPLMQPAAERLSQALEKTEIAPSGYGAKVMSNVTGEAHDAMDGTAVKARLVEQLTKPVRWEQCVRSAAAERSAGSTWLELCPGKTLSGMMRKIDRKIKVTSLDEPSTA